MELAAIWNKKQTAQELYITACHSEKNISKNSWSHKSIVLKPLSFDSSFYPIELKDEELKDLKIIGEFITELNL